jgi:hypothetical protein
VNQSKDPFVADPVLQKLDQPVTVKLVKKALDIGIYDPIHSFFMDRVRQSIQRLVLAAARSEAIAEPEKVLLVDALKYGADRMLDDLVLQ